VIKIVLVDDHAVVRSGLRLLLDAQEDMEVIGEAGNAKDAIFRARALKRHSSPTEAPLLPALWNCAKRSPHETERVPIGYVKVA